MAERLRTVLARMVNDGVEERNSYRLDEAGHIVRLMHSLPRTFAALLWLEAYIVEEFVRFCVRSSRNAPGPAAGEISGRPGPGIAT